MHVRSKSNVMLAELVVVVLFFSLIAVIVTQMFVATAQRGKLNQRTQIALVHAQDVAEMLRQEADVEHALDQDGFAQVSPGIYEKLLRADEYRVRVSLSQEQASPAGLLWEGRIAVLDEKHPVPAQDGAESLPTLAELPLAVYAPLEEVEL